MSKKDSKLLLSIKDRVIAEEIERILEDSNIFCVLTSDNPAASVINAYMGSQPAENIDIIVNIEDYEKAVDILSNNQYKELISFT